MVGYIYLITDTTNGMKYTGKHHYHIEGQLDPNYHGSGTIIKNIYKKRPETLKEEYIKTCYSEEEMCSDEQYYIKVFKTLWPNGYNLTEGGDGLIPCEETRKKLSKAHKGKILSEEHRRKISETHMGLQSGEKHPFYGKHHTEETRRKLSNSHKGLCVGEKHPFYGKHHTEETRRKLSNSHKGKHHTEESKKKMSDAHSGENNPFYGKHHTEEFKKKFSKIVLQFTLDGEFIREWPSTREIERQLGFDNSAVGRCCLGKQKSAYGYIWRYK